MEHSPATLADLPDLGGGMPEFWPIVGDDQTIDVEEDGEVLATLSLHVDDHGPKLTIAQPSLPDDHPRRLRVIRLGE